jgi:hypothetical protein
VARALPTQKRDWNYSCIPFDRVYTKAFLGSLIRHTNG